MISGLLLSLFLGYFPMLLFAVVIYWMDRFEKEPLGLLVFIFIWGSVFAAGISFLLNTLLGVGVFWLSNSQIVTNISVTSIIAPVVEEILKGLVVAVIYFFIRKEFDSPLDGIVYGAMVGLGFAATENFYYIFSMGFQSDGFSGILRMAAIRVILVGWQHPFYTAFVGLGFAIARINKNQFLKIISPPLGLLVAILTHSFHNTLSTITINLAGTTGMFISSFIDWFGWSLLILLIIGLIKQEQKRIRSTLAEEVALGTMTNEQYVHACTKALQRSFVKKLKKENPAEVKNARIFFQISSELAHKRWQYRNFGDEGGNHKMILAMRNTLSRLSPLIPIRRSSPQ